MQFIFFIIDLSNVISSRPVLYAYDIHSYSRFNGKHGLFDEVRLASDHKSFYNQFLTVAGMAGFNFSKSKLLSFKRLR